MIDAVLKQILTALEKQNKLLEQQLQRNDQLTQWRKANAELSKRCHRAAMILGQAQQELLEEIVEEVEDPNSLNGFMLHEFIDKYALRIAHLNNMMQVFMQLGTP